MQIIEFHLKFNGSECLDEILEYIRKIKEAHPDANIYVEVGGK